MAAEVADDLPEFELPTGLNVLLFPAVLWPNVVKALFGEDAHKGPTVSPPAVMICGGPAVGTG